MSVILTILAIPTLGFLDLFLKETYFNAGTMYRTNPYADCDSLGASD